MSLVPFPGLLLEAVKIAKNKFCIHHLVWFHFDLELTCVCIYIYINYIYI